MSSTLQENCYMINQRYNLIYSYCSWWKLSLTSSLNSHYKIDNVNNLLSLTHFNLIHSKHVDLRTYLIRLTALFFLLNIESTNLKTLTIFRNYRIYPNIIFGLRSWLWPQSNCLSFSFDTKIFINAH